MDRSSMKIWNKKEHKFHWSSKQGKADTIVEHIVQFVHAHRLLLYIAVVTTLTLAFQIFHINIIGGI